MRKGPTSIMGFHHQLVNGFELGVIIDSNSLRFNIGHVNGSSALEIFEGLGDKQPQDLKVRRLYCVQDIKPV